MIAKPMRAQDVKQNGAIVTLAPEKLAALGLHEHHWRPMENLPRPQLDVDISRDGWRERHRRWVIGTKVDGYSMCTIKKREISTR